MSRTLVISGCSRSVPSAVHRTPLTVPGQDADAPAICGVLPQAALGAAGSRPAWPRLPASSNCVTAPVERVGRGRPALVVLAVAVASDADARQLPTVREEDDPCRVGSDSLMVYPEGEADCADQAGNAEGPREVGDVVAMLTPVTRPYWMKASLPNRRLTHCQMGPGPRPSLTRSVEATETATQAAGQAGSPAARR